MDWTTVAVINKSKNTVAALHREYGSQIDRLHAEYGAELKKYSKLVDEWIAYADKLEAELKVLKAQQASPTYA